MLRRASGSLCCGVYGLMVSFCQPESSCQLVEVVALIWKGRGKSLMLKFRRISAATSLGAVLDKVPASKTGQLATAPTARKAWGRAVYSVENVPTVTR